MRRMSDVRIRRLGDVRQEITVRLRVVSDTPALDAEVLLYAATGLPRSALLARPEIELTGAQEAGLRSLCERRLRGEPMAYITGTREFWSMDFALTPDVLIPRPETEHLVEYALNLIPANVEWRIADLGTGSGAVAIALARERPRCRVVASDLSEAALAVARANARRLGAGDIEWRRGDWLDALAGLPPFDLIVSNPPYVRSDDPHLERGDVRFEPRLALDGGADGLNVIRVLIAHAHRWLRAGGTLLLEHGADQAASVHALFRRHAWRGVRQLRDYAKLARLSAGTRPVTP